MNKLDCPIVRDLLPLPAFLPFIMPILNLLAGFLGYLAGSKKIFLSDYIFVVKEKVKEKFNE